MRRCFALTSVLLPLLAATAVSQWNANTAINNAVCVAPQEQRSPAVASDGRNGAIIVWEDNRFGNTDIFAQRIAYDGRMLWSANGVPVCTASGAQQRPDIISDGAGGVIVVWEDARGLDIDIYAQRIDSNGVARWTANGVAVCTAPWQQQYPHLVTDTREGAIVCWQDGRNIGFDVYAQRMAYNGAPQWTTNGIPVCSVEHSHVLPQIAPDGHGGAIVVWEDGRNGVSQGDIYAQRITPSGGVAWDVRGIAVCSAFNSQRAPQIVRDGSGGAIIVWQDHRSATNSPGDIYAQHIDSLANMLWTVNGTVVCNAAGAQTAPRISTDGLGGSFICWTDERTQFSTVIYAQFLAPDGQTRWQTNGVTPDPASSSIAAPRIEYDGMRGALLVWQERKSVNDYDIYSQRIDSTGSLRWGGSGAVICNAANSQLEPQVLADLAGGGIIAWIDRRSDTTLGDVYTSRVNPLGFIPVVLSQFTASVTGDGVLLRWRTERESGSTGFTVERSTDGAAWQTAGFVASTSGRGAHEYAFTDESSHLPAAPSIWYRLRQHDADGSTALSGMLQVSMLAAPGPQLLRAVYPVPSCGAITADVVLDRAETVTMSLHDAVGRLVARVLDARAFDAGAHSVLVPVHALAAGAYTLVLDTDARREVRTVLVSR